MKLCKLLFAVVGATVLLGALVSTASARSIEGNTTTLTATFTSVRFRGLFGTTDCIVTLSGSLHSRTITKSPNTLLGYINDARLGACATGTATILTETLPWHVRYLGFVGTLPNITRIDTNVTRSSFRIRTPEGFNCLAASSEAEPARGEFVVNAARQISEVRISGTIETSCGIPGTFTSAGGTVRGSAGTITVRLI